MYEGVAGRDYLLVPMLASKFLRRIASSESDSDKADASISLLEYLITFRTCKITCHVTLCHIIGYILPRNVVDWGIKGEERRT